ncbi:hypothetical protein HYS91_01640 [Candidatus Daviesbacteria bacterium]|nr:hypothetical protein [Candidatus Daviesbacteria bacterium]
MSEFEGPWDIEMEKIWEQYKGQRTPDVPTNRYLEFGEDGQPLEDYRLNQLPPTAQYISKQPNRLKIFATFPYHVVTQANLEGRNG